MSEKWLRVRNNKYVLAAELLILLFGFLLSAGIALALIYNSLEPPKNLSNSVAEFAAVSLASLFLWLLKRSFGIPLQAGPRTKVTDQEIAEMRALRESWRSKTR